MPNPSGKNQLPGGKQDPPYGQGKRTEALSQAAPMAGSSSAAVNAPRNAQRAAVKGKRAGQPKQPKVLARPADAFHPTGPPEAEQPVSPDVAQVWREISLIPGVTPLAGELATRAQQGSSGGLV